MLLFLRLIISYQAITGNNNVLKVMMKANVIISYQAITGNNNKTTRNQKSARIISYQAITGNNNDMQPFKMGVILYHTKR